MMVVGVASAQSQPTHATTAKYQQRQKVSRFTGSNPDLAENMFCRTQSFLLLEDLSDAIA
jgi:hypothetical protein